jgi:hypothetical protein
MIKQRTPAPTRRRSAEGLTGYVTGITNKSLRCPEFLGLEIH